MSKASSPQAGQAANKKRGLAWPAARRPAWLLDSELEWLPDDTRQEAVTLIASSYQELVVEAASALERAAGEEFVFLFWLGLVRSLRLRGHSLPGQALLCGSHPDTEVQYYLQLGLAKQRVTNLLLRVKEWHARWQRDTARHVMAAPGGDLRVATAEAAASQLSEHPCPAPLTASSAEQGMPNGPSPADAPVTGKGAGDAHVSGTLNAEKSESRGAKNGQPGDGAGPHPSPLPGGEGVDRSESGPATNGSRGNSGGPHPSPLPGGEGVDRAPPSHTSPPSQNSQPSHAGQRCGLPSVARDDGLEKPKSEGQQASGTLKALAANRATQSISVHQAKSSTPAGSPGSPGG